MRLGYILTVCGLLVGCDDDLHGFQGTKAPVGASCAGPAAATYVTVPSGPEPAPTTTVDVYAALLGGGDSLAVALGVNETQTGTCALSGGSSDVVVQVKSQSVGSFSLPKHGSVTYDAGTGATAASSATVTITGYDPAVGAGLVCGTVDAMFDAGALEVDFKAAVYCRQDD